MKTPEQAKAEKEAEEFELLAQKVSKEIEIILTREGLGLQPYLVVSEFGIVPRVRLSKKNDKK